MTRDEFSQWRTEAIPRYAADKVKSGRWSDAESLAEAEKEFAMLLPDGHRTVDHTLYTIESESGHSVGVIWISRAERAAGPIGYIHDLVVWPEHRRMGYAEQAMRSLEQEALALGLRGLALHVFGHNRSAQELYRRLGYQPTNINMFKSVVHTT